MPFADTEKRKAYDRKRALAYYHRNKDSIRIKRKIDRDTNPDYKIKRQIREDSPQYRIMRHSYHLKRTYGITIEKWNEMYSSQFGKCAICQADFDGMDKKHIHIDHDHETGAIRQLLCTKCNHAIGNLNEDVNLFEKAVDYLKKWKMHEQI